MICNLVIDKYHFFQKTNRYIVDTNVLLALYGDKIHVNGVKTNSKLKEAVDYFQKALNCSASIFVPSIVVSEFVNRYFHARFDDLKQRDDQKFQQFKRDYRKSEEYVKDSKFILSVLTDVIFAKLSLISDDFETVNIKQLFNFDNDDFNDKLVVHIANKNNLFLISADMDMKNLPIK